MDWYPSDENITKKLSKSLYGLICNELGHKYEKEMANFFEERGLYVEMPDNPNKPIYDMLVVDNNGNRFLVQQKSHTDQESKNRYDFMKPSQQKTMELYILAKMYDCKPVVITFYPSHFVNNNQMAYEAQYIDDECCYNQCDELTFYGSVSKIMFDYYKEKFARRDVHIKRICQPNEHNCDFILIDKGGYKFYAYILDEKQSNRNIVPHISNIYIIGDIVYGSDKNKLFDL